MTIEQEIWGEFKKLSEHNIWERISSAKAKAHFGLKYEDRIENVSTYGRIITGDADYKIEKALRSEVIDWDEIRKLYPVRPEIKLRKPYKPKYPKPKYRSKAENKAIGRIIIQNWNEIRKEIREIFPTEESARDYLELKRWNGHPACPNCGSQHVHRFSTDKRLFKCNQKQCRKGFSIISGTMFENTKITLIKWYEAIYLLTSMKTNKISSNQLGIALGVQLKSAWLILNKIKVSITDNKMFEINKEITWLQKK